MATALSTAKQRAGFTIGASCPGCGGEVELGTDFFVTECHHCGSALRLILPSAPPAYFAKSRFRMSQARAALDRRLKESGKPLTTSSWSCEQVLYPYWKLDLLTVKVRTVIEGLPQYIEPAETADDEPRTTSRRTVAITPSTITVAAGPPHPAIPASIGLRADYIKLYPFSTGNHPDEFTALPVELDGDSALARANSSTKTINAIAESAPGGQPQTNLVGLRASVCYLPYFIFSANRISSAVDALSGRVVSENVTVEEHAELKRSLPLGEIGLELHRCPTCGADLPTKPSLVYFCRNCGRNVLLSGADGSQILCAPHTERDLLVPFWRIGESIVPAFRISNAEAMYRLTRRVTGGIGKLVFEGAIESTSNISPVTLSQREAAIVSAIVDYRFKLDRNSKATFQLPGALPESTELLLIPFRPEEYFWVDSILSAISFERALLK